MLRFDVSLDVDALAHTACTATSEDTERLKMEAACLQQPRQKMRVSHTRCSVFGRGQ